MEHNLQLKPKVKFEVIQYDLVISQLEVANNLEKGHVVTIPKKGHRQNCQVLISLKGVPLLPTNKAFQMWTKNKNMTSPELLKRWPLHGTDLYIYLHEYVIFMVNVGKYTVHCNWWFYPTHLKNMFATLHHFPQFSRKKQTKSLKPPPTLCNPALPGSKTLSMG